MLNLSLNHIFSGLEKGVYHPFPSGKETAVDGHQVEKINK